jgi:hypothetical protein
MQTTSQIAGKQICHLTLGCPRTSVPMSLIAIFLGYFLFAMMSAYGYNANESYVTLLGNWGMLIMGAYFGGRTVEKLAEMRKK